MHTQPQGCAAPRPSNELGRRHVALHRQAAGGRPQVLADGEHVDAGASAVGEQLLDFVRLLAQTDHDAGLDERVAGNCASGRLGGGPSGRPAGRTRWPARVRAALLCARVPAAAILRPRPAVLMSPRPARRPLEKLPRAPVRGLRAHAWVEARHRLQVVTDHVGPRREHRSQRLGVATHVGHEQLHGRRRHGGAQGADHGGVGVGAAVGQVVTGDARHHYVAQAEPAGGLRHTLRLIFVVSTEAGWLTGQRGGGGRRRTGPGRHTRRRPRPVVVPHRAEAAGARAHITENEEGRRAGREALAFVGAARLLADGVQVETAQQRLGGAVWPCRGRPHLEPSRLARRTLALTSHGRAPSATVMNH